MAKSGQKKAFEEETVLDRGPREELEVGRRSDVDYSNNIRVAASTPGVWLSPEVWDGLSKMSDNIHSARRNNWMIDESLRLGKIEVDNAYLLKAHEDLLKREATIEANQFNTQSEYDLEEKLEQGKRMGLNSREIVTKHYQDQQKLLNSKYAQSPFIYDAVNNYNNNLFSKSILKALEYDYAATEEKAKYDFGTSVNLAISSITTNPNISVDDAMDSLSLRLGPLMAMITDKDEAPYLNTAYNALLIAKSETIATSYKLGSISLEEATGALTSLIKDYDKKKWVLKNTRGEDTQDEYEVTNSSVKQITDLIQSLNSSKTGSDTESLYGADTYLNLVDASGIESGHIIDNEYIMRTSLAKAKDDFHSAVEPLIVKAANGNKAAGNKADKIIGLYYNTIFPSIAIREVLAGEIASGKSPATVIQNMGDRLNRVAIGIDKNPNASFDDLIFQSGPIVFNLNMPTSAEDSDLWRYYAGNASNPEQVRRLYYKNIVNAGRALIRGDVIGNLVTGDGEVANKFELIRTGIGPNVAVITDVKSGQYSINYSNLPEMTRRKQEWKAAYQSASGGRVTNMPVAQYVKTVANEYSTVDLQTKLLGYAANGLSDADAGLTDMYLNMNFDSLKTNDEKDAANTMAMMALLKKSGNTVAIDQVQSYIIAGGRLAGKYSGDADSMLKGLTRGDDGLEIGAYVDSLMDAYNIPAGFRPALRYTLTNVALAEALGPGAGVTGSGKFKEGTVNLTKTLDEGIMSKLFTRSGTAKFLNVLQNSNISVEQVDNMVARVNDKLSKDAKFLGASSRDINVSFNNSTGQIEINMGYTQGTLYGYSSATKGGMSGEIPIVVDVTNRPANMSQYKYQDAIAMQVESLARLQYIASVEAQPMIQKMVDEYNQKFNNDKSSPKVTYSEVLMLALQQLEAGVNPENQAGYVKYYESNYTNEPVGSPNRLLSYIMTGIDNRKIPSNKADHAMLAGAVMQGGAVRPRSELDTPEAYARGKYLGYMDAHKISKNSINKDVSSIHIYNPADTANIETALTRRGFKVTDKIRYPGNANYSESSYHSYKSRRAIDVGCASGFDNFVKDGKIETKVLDNLVQFCNEYNGSIHRILFTRKEFWTDPEYKRYREMKNANGELLFTNKVGGKTDHNHDDHFHIVFNEAVYDAKGNFISTKSQAARSFVNNMSYLITHNTNERITDSAGKTLATLWPKYKPNDFDAKICNESVNLLNSSDEYRMIALGKRYAYLRDSVFNGRGDYAFAALSGVPFKFAKKPGAPKSLKEYNELVTLDQILKLHFSKGVEFEYYAYMPVYDNMSDYSKKCLTSARRMGAY